MRVPTAPVKPVTAPATVKTGRRPVGKTTGFPDVIDPVTPVMTREDRIIAGTIVKYSTNGLARIEERTDANKIISVWYRPLNADVATDLKRFAVGDRVIARLRGDAIVKITSPLNDDPRKPKREKTSTPWLPDDTDRAEVARQEAVIATRAPHSGYLSEDDEPDDETSQSNAPVVSSQKNKPGKKLRRGLQHSRDTALPDAQQLGPESTRVIRLSCSFCNGPTHADINAEVLCMNATRFSRKRRRARGEMVASDDDE